MTLRLLHALGIAAVCLASGAVLAAEPARVAVLPVVIHSLEESGYLRAGISEMLSSRLNQQDGVAAIRVDDANSATSDADAARAAGKAAGAEWVLFGSFTRFGEGASLDLRCLPVDSAGEATQRAVFVHAGGLSDVIPRLDSVVERIGAHVRGGAANASVPSVSAAPAADMMAEVQALRGRIEALEARAKATQASATGGADTTN
jgi:outer membrane protein insertion porin family